MTSPIPNSRSPLSNSDAVSSEEERGCAGGGGSAGTIGTGEAAGAVAAAGLSGAAEVLAIGACGNGAAGAGNSGVAARPEGRSLARRLVVASAALPSAGIGFAPGPAAMGADDGAGLSAIFSPAGRIRK